MSLSDSTWKFQAWTIPQYLDFSYAFRRLKRTSWTINVNFNKARFRKIFIKMDMPNPQQATTPTLPASMLIDPEDREINSKINLRGFTNRASVSRANDLLVEDWKKKLTDYLGGNITLSSMDLKLTKTKEREYFGTTVFDCDDVVCVLYESTNKSVFFHFWSDKDYISEDHCMWVEENLFEDKKKDILDVVTNTRELTFWGAMGGDYEAFNRKVVLLEWDEHVQVNYPPNVLNQLNLLRDLKPPIEGGKIILCHGKPGTGKTSFLRSLARHWTKFCHTSYITDPENFLGSAGAMLKVITWDYQSYIDREVDPKDAYHLLIIEDADELISQDAKRQTGQALSRLLNIGDGLLGHSTNLLICITTNVEMKEVHAAVSRSGRCLANIYFEEFTYDEAAHWLSVHHEDLSPASVGLKLGDSYSLADLYEMTSKAKRIVHKQKELVTGVYL
jgi:energy-coupling factor transporter ATP-binding protein EcfA2